MIWYWFRCQKSVKCQQNLAKNCSSVLKLVSLEVVSLEAPVNSIFKRVLRAKIPIKGTEKAHFELINRIESRMKTPVFILFVAIAIAAFAETTENRKVQKRYISLLSVYLISDRVFND